MKISTRFVLTSCVVALAGMGFPATAQDTPFPLMPNVSMEPNGTLHFKDHTVPMPTFMSAEAKARYVEILKQSLKARVPNTAGAQQGAQQAAAAQQARQQAPTAAGVAGTTSGNDAVLKFFPAGKQDTEIGGVKVTIYTPKDIAARNKNRVAMMFNSVPTGIALASVGKMKVITAPTDTTQIIAVYRELLKTHKPSQIALVGLSGGCQAAGNTTVWLPHEKLPFPGAVGLLTCAGGGAPGDTRITLDGLDPRLSSYTTFGATRTARRSARPQAKSDGPPREILEVETFPKGWPPSYLLSGTRDLSLSQTVVLHRRLKNAGATTELNIWEGMWHGFNIEPELPETREAAADLAKFLDRYLGT